MHIKVDLFGKWTIRFPDISLTTLLRVKKGKCHSKLFWITSHPWHVITISLTVFCFFSTFIITSNCRTSAALSWKPLERRVAESVSFWKLSVHIPEQQQKITSELWRERNSNEDVKKDRWVGRERERDRRRLVARKDDEALVSLELLSKSYKPCESLANPIIWIP